MADLLNFNPNRELEFSPGRPLEFDSRRPLEFDSRRELEFNANRDLGFGRRGVVFRGFVCPICGALVTEDAKRCNECGATFDDGSRAGAPPARTPTGPGKTTPAPPKTPKVPAPPARPSATTTYCAYCGAKVKRTDTFCWNCGARARGDSEVVKLPSQKVESVTREWRQGR